MERLPNIHPGEILFEEFMKPHNIFAYRLAKSLDIPQIRVSQIIKGNRKITADTALRLSSFFGNPAQFRLGFQNDYDIEAGTIRLAGLLNRIRETGKQSFSNFQTS